MGHISQTKFSIKNFIQFENGTNSVKIHFIKDQSSLHVLFVDRFEKFRIVANGNGKKTEILKVENAKIHTKVHCCSIGGRRRSQRRDLFHTSFIVFVAIVRN